MKLKSVRRGVRILGYSIWQRAQPQHPTKLQWTTRKNWWNWQNPRDRNWRNENNLNWKKKKQGKSSHWRSSFQTALPEIHIYPGQKKPPQIRRDCKKLGDEDGFNSNPMLGREKATYGEKKATGWGQGEGSKIAYLDDKKGEDNKVVNCPTEGRKSRWDGQRTGLKCLYTNLDCLRNKRSELLHIIADCDPDIHRAALITQQSLAAKLTLKYQIDFPAISRVYWINIPQSTCTFL